jgi:DNA replication and repair protein RecF
LFGDNTVYISRLAVDHYRSWDNCVVDLEPGVNILQGRNGLGKTNLVEAVEVLSTGSSHRVSTSAPLVHIGDTSATIRANVHHRESSETLEFTVATRGANRGRVDSGPSLYARDVIGRLNCVVFAPDDQRLVSSDPAQRRSFIDQACSQLNPMYAELLQRSRHIAKQRVALLKQLSQQPQVSEQSAALSGLEIWTGQFIDVGVQLTKERAELISDLQEEFAHAYSSLAGQGNQARLDYQPSFSEVLDNDDPRTAISEHYQRLYAGEVSRGQNLIGPHRDDMLFRLNGMNAREYASNGEMWTLALALKLALFTLMKRRLGTTPVVILDDVFAQLDESRRAQILAFASTQEQVLITVAAESDVPGLLEVREGQNGSGGVHLIDVQQLVDRQHNDDYEMLLKEQMKGTE